MKRPTGEMASRLTTIEVSSGDCRFDPCVGHFVFYILAHGCPRYPVAASRILEPPMASGRRGVFLHQMIATRILAGGTCSGLSSLRNHWYLASHFTPPSHGRPSVSNPSVKLLTEKRRCAGRRSTGPAKLDVRKAPRPLHMYIGLLRDLCCPPGAISSVSS